MTRKSGMAQGLKPCQLFTRFSLYRLAKCAAILKMKFLNIAESVGPKPRKLYGIEGRERVQNFYLFLFLVAMFVSLVGCHPSPEPDVEAKVSFTQVPQSNPGDRNLQDVMEGTVSGARPGQRMVIYSKSGGLWWLQPLLTAPYTPILPNQVWRNETHLGTDYAALLVDPSYQPAAVLAELPKRGALVSAVATSPGQQKSSSFFVDFSGYTWRVRKQPSDRGGTTNPYNPDNVYTDQAGALHLRIMNRNEQWTCSEVNLTRSLGYGTYTFTVQDTSKLEPSVMFGMFTWDYSTDKENHREFDIDISRWGDPDGKNAEFIVQPSFVPANISRFMAPAGKLKYTIDWEASRLNMSISRVSGTAKPAVLRSHVFTSEVPTPGSESVRITLFVYWNRTGVSPGIHHPAEVVVDRFEFLP